ncbi:MAG: PIN domain-containing protein [Brevundimonas sp.]|nr:MAG: PIN domain-containing protein [Brevundimonas sp.]
MKVVADTNVILRLLVRDDERQTRLAVKTLKEAESVALPLVALCEAVWVMGRTYGLPHTEIAAKLRDLIAIPTADYDALAVEAGLAILDAGGDFADGVIAASGAVLGGDTFVSFDRRAVKLLAETGQATRLLA